MLEYDPVDGTKVLLRLRIQVNFVLYGSVPVSLRQAAAGAAIGSDSQVPVGALVAQRFRHRSRTWHHVDFGLGPAVVDTFAKVNGAG